MGIGKFHPMEQSYKEWEVEYKLKRDRFWISLTKANQEYRKTIEEEYSPDKFNEWLLSKYGLQIHTNGMGIESTYDIKDEKKYLMYLLKFKS